MYICGVNPFINADYVLIISVYCIIRECENCRVSLVVMEIFDAGLLGEGAIETVFHAWENLLNLSCSLKVPTNEFKHKLKIRFIYIKIFTSYLRQNFYILIIIEYSLFFYIF